MITGNVASYNCRFQREKDGGEEEGKEGSHLLTSEHLEGIALGEVGAESDLLQLKEVLYLLWEDEENRC